MKKTYFFIMIFSFLSVSIISVLYLKKKDAKYTKSIKLSTVNNTIVHYSDDIDTSEVYIFCDFLEKSQILKGTFNVDILLNITQRSYNVSFNTSNITSTLSDSLILSALNLFKESLSYNLGVNKNVELFLHTPNSDKRNSVPYYISNEHKNAMPFSLLLRHNINDFQYLLYDYYVNQSDIEKTSLAISKLKNYFPPNLQLVFALTSSKEKKTEYDFCIFIPQLYWNNTRVISRIKNTIEYIKSYDIEKKINAKLIDPVSLVEKKI